MRSSQRAWPRGLLLISFCLTLSCEAPVRNFSAPLAECSADGAVSDARCPAVSGAIGDSGAPALSSGHDSGPPRQGPQRDGGSASTDAGGSRFSSDGKPSNADGSASDAGGTPSNTNGTHDDAGRTPSSDEADAASIAAECLPDTQRSLACGRCGASDQTCGTDERWAEPSECVDEGPCTPDEQQLGDACERCGVSARTCLADCTWGEWSCTQAGECEVAEVRVEQDSCEACGEEKTRSRTCTESCTWEDWSEWSACTPTSCAVGELQSEEDACGYCGQTARTRTCQNECGFSEWSEWGECVGSGACEPGHSDTEEQACGMCGTRTRARSCTTDCGWASWGAWSACLGQGACEPGQSQTRYATDPCGRCGKRVEQRTCSDDCTWGNWSAGECIEQGECTAGASATREQACGCSGTRTVVRTCSESCEWHSWDASGACNGDTPTSTYYADTDRDGFGDPTTSTETCGSAPAGYVANNRDCCDRDAKAYPGQTEWFSSPTACGSYDYDCDGKETQETRSPFNEERRCSVATCEETVVAGNNTPCGDLYVHENCYRAGPTTCSARVFSEPRTRSCR